jgi:hypothetical protein
VYEREERRGMVEEEREREEREAERKRRGNRDSR